MIMNKVTTNTWIDDIDRNIIPYVEIEDCEYLYPTVNGLQISIKEYSKLSEYTMKWYKESKNILWDRLDTIRNSNSNDDIFTEDMEIVYQFIKSKEDIYSDIIRLDFVKDIYGEFKMVEANADTPCAISESFYGNLLYRDDPQQWESTVMDIGKLFVDKLNDNKGYIVFSSSSYQEDWYNTKYLYECTKVYIERNGLKEVYCNICELGSLEIFDDGVFLNGKKIDVLYRLHPIELLIEDVTDDGYKIGWKLIELHYEKKVVLVNPPSSIFLQNKNLMKYLSHLDFVPNTYDKDHINSGDKFHIVYKEVYGREGENIRVFDNKKEYDTFIRTDSFTTNECIIQDFIEQEPVPNIIVCDSNGDKQDKDLYITYSIFLLNGKPSVLYLRGSLSYICDYSSFWIPSYVYEDKSTSTDDGLSIEEFRNNLNKR